MTAFVAFLAAVTVVAIAAGVLFAIEFWAVAHRKPTISEGAQKFTAMLDKQLLVGIVAVIFLAIGWFLAHFADPVCGG